MGESVNRKRRQQGFRLVWTRSAGGGRTSGLVEDTSAQAMVEFAIVAPLLIIIIFGIMELALMFNAYQQVHYAAFVAVRSAIVTIPEAYPKGPDEDREDPYLMAQEGSKTPKRNAMELAAEIAMIPVSSPISAVVSDGIGNLPSMLSNLETQFNNLMSDLGLSGGSSSGLPFADFFDGLGNLGSLGDMSNITDGLGSMGNLLNLLQGFPGLGSFLSPDLAGQAFARFHPSDILDRRSPSAPSAWALGSGGGGGGGDLESAGIPGMRQVHTEAMTVPGEMGLPEIILRSADKLVTSMLATKARAIDPTTKEPLADDFAYKPGESLTVRVTHYYNPKMPVVRKIFWKLYLMFGIRERVNEYMESSGLAGTLPEAMANEMRDQLTNAIGNFLGGIDLPYYPIPIHADATLPIEGNRWCTAVSRDPAPQAGPGANEPCPY